jgi:chorismate-pyruvate lyase
MPAAAILEHLYQPFPDSPDRPRIEEIPAHSVPQPYHRLLVHTHHMTVTVEEFYGMPVQVRVLAVKKHGLDYARKILLLAGNRVVQFGLVRIDLAVCPESIRQAILAEKVPLGRILIEHNMLRRIEPQAYLRVTLSAAMAEWFGVEAASRTYGRVGVIYSGERPVVDVLEILAPIPPHYNCRVSVSSA